MYDFYRIATAVPDLKVGDVAYNKNKIIEKIDDATKEGANIIVFPELSITGYTCGDLFFQEILIRESKKALCDLVAVSSVVEMLIAVGAPVKIGYQLYNACVIIYKGVIWGINIKSYLPNYNEFYEKRWFSSAEDLDVTEVSSKEILDDENGEYFIPVGNDLTYNLKNELVLGAEICEDLWAPVTPSTFMALSGAEVIVNLSASNEGVGKREFRRNLIKSKSTTLACDYIYVSSGIGESTTDLVFSGHSVIAENGKILKENDRCIDNDYILVADIDLGKIRADRLKGKSYKDAYRIHGKSIDCRQVYIDVDSSRFGSDGMKYEINPHPFIPKDENKRYERCMDIFNMQVNALVKRLRVTGGKLVVGVSGGMDSTLALLVSCKTLAKLNRPMTDLVGITMPAFGTTDRTYNNSLKLMETLGISQQTISIKEACTLHYQDIGHDINVKDLTFENVQARERTQVLMDYANKIGGLVVGTGDLSELALGWCTYNADQMSMYGVNASIPKTLIKWMIESIAKNNIFPQSTEVLMDIIDTPISPELLPPDENGNISQKTEDSVGPYELHDFFIYYMLRYCYTPSKIFYLAKRAFADKYDGETIVKWMKLFYKRFFTQQFKRSCMPDGVKVGSIGLSPRGDLRMPSDASYNLWMKEIDNILK